MGGNDVDDDKRRSKRASMGRNAAAYREEIDETQRAKIWGGVILFGLFGATVTTFAVFQLRRTVDWVFSEFTRSQSRKRADGSFRSAFQEEAWRKYKRRLQEEYEEEIERVERIRRMQRAFNRERNKFRRSYDRWSEYGPGGAYGQHFQQDDWYWNTNTSFRDWNTNYRDARREPASYPLSHHYAVLGLNRSRNMPYTDAEIKKAFRAKAMKFHPDQNQENKESAEAKFKEVMISYEAIKQERNSANL